MDRNDIFAYTLRTLLNPVWDYIEDNEVSEILINGPNDVYIEKQGKLIHTDTKFEDEERLLAACRNIVQYSGTEFDENRLRVDARLPDGSRVHIIFPPLARNGTCVAIRKFSRVRIDLPSLTERGILSQQASAYLQWCVLTNRNILIAGGTSSGKTTLLNALTDIIPRDQRIITIEDTFELQLEQPHVVGLETRTDVSAGEKPVTMRDLFTSSLRMRPDRIIIGELRGGEALDYLQAMISGHGGSLSTVHADSPLDALQRLETLVILSGVELPHHAVRAQVRSAIHVIVQMSKGYGGARVISEISEVDREAGADGQHSVNRLFSLSHVGKELQTELKATGNSSALQPWHGELPDGVDLSSISDILPS